MGTTDTETLYGTAARAFLVLDGHGASYWTETGEPVLVRETRSGKYVIHSRRLAAKSVRMTWDKVIARVDPS